jgi:hypothetical protein
MSWRLARSLDVLRAEVNAAAPSRSKRSDGTIGDAAHRATWSDHNPNASGVVCALDLTHDPAGGADMNVIADHIRKRGHPALKYLIWSRRIYSVARAGEGWRPYGGSNPHTSHLHVSVGIGSDGRSVGPYDNTSPWGISSTGISVEDALIGTKEGDGVAPAKPDERVKCVQRLIVQAGHGKLLDPDGVDGVWWKKTSAALLACRRDVGSEVKTATSLTGEALAQLLVAMARHQARAHGGGGTGGGTVIVPKDLAVDTLTAKTVTTQRLVSGG